MRGAYWLISLRGAGSVLSIVSRIDRRPARAWSIALSMIAVVMPVILMSICTAVMPLAVPQTLKSMSPR